MSEAIGSKQRATVFYSWQSDLPNAVNRSLIQDALERAVKEIKADGALHVDPVLDRDTQNVPGSPDIAHTIFQKIETAAAFVADVSIINPGLGRPMPNPNVLIELGYALKTLGDRRTILVANTATGPVEALPFDLRTKRVLTYHLSSGSSHKPEQRKKLQDTFGIALRAILSEVAPHRAFPSLTDLVIESIAAGAPNQSALCAKVIPAIATSVGQLTPKLRRENRDEWDDQLIGAIQQTLPLVKDFARVAHELASHNSREAVLRLFRGFDTLFAQYHLPPGVSGAFYEVQFDLPKFIGHELMLTLFAALIEERRWELIAELCRENVMIPDTSRRFHAETPVTYTYASEFLKLLDDRNRRLQLNRISLHADILKERHETGDLGDLSPWKRIQDADLFLYLRSVFEQPDQDSWNLWAPWTAELLQNIPRFLIEATQREKAEQLLKPLSATDLTDFRHKLRIAIGKLRHYSRQPFMFPLGNLNPDSIGSQ